ncbi:peptidase M20 [Aquaticitalea lipolytica]|uniref:Peptidase M20 n=1 Tax=Aquaticitalea lipolytica TaxID=1247562 RepID=A0A8J2TKD3_9FLAO|nr:amidohydrolase [Aquaticitalea lipolytica]GFZ76690.1 peptidase M20 [Aquaticitalea lipolytica]
MISKEILKLRKELHQNPELSGNEINTAKRIKEFILTHNPTKIIENVGGNGLLAIFEFSKNGPTITIRCELDALPIVESNTFSHKSLIEGVSHKCGHDGHMAIVAGLALWIKNQKFKTGKIVFLFQPAEETGKGAFNVLNDERFKNLKSDYIFALHNIPGEPLHSVIAMKKEFSAEVQSLAIYLTGKEAHASEPENAINPALGISTIVTELSKLNVLEPHKDNFSILTPIHINMGEKSYGISPSHGELHYTLRTWNETIMNTVKRNIEDVTNKICKTHNLNYTIDWFEYFPSSKNTTDCNTLVNNAAITNKLTVIERPFPFKFGEDFGWFSKSYKTAMFGLGAGINTPALHHNNYDFPEELIETGIKMFTSIITSVLEE